MTNNKKKNNSSKKLSNITKKIKKNETKYTFILVIFFMILFIFIGYYTLRINTPDLNNEVSTLDNNYSISLTNNDILDDTKGINNTIHNFDITNTLDKELNYRIILNKDSSNISNKYVKYSLDKKSINVVDNDNYILYEGVLQRGEVKNFNISFWLNNTIDKSINYQYQAEIIIETNK